MSKILLNIEFDRETYRNIIIPSTVSKAMALCNDIIDTSVNVATLHDYDEGNIDVLSTALEWKIVCSCSNGKKSYYQFYTKNTSYYTPEKIINAFMDCQTSNGYINKVVIYSLRVVQ